MKKFHFYEKYDRRCGIDLVPTQSRNVISSEARNLRISEPVPSQTRKLIQLLEIAVYC